MQQYKSSSSKCYIMRGIFDLLFAEIISACHIFLLLFSQMRIKAYGKSTFYSAVFCTSIRASVKQHPFHPRTLILITLLTLLT